MYIFGSSSEKSLVGIRNELVDVNRRALSYGLMDFTVYSGLRSTEEQAAYFAQGRQPLDIVNDLRLSAGLSFITLEENSKPVTWTMKSNHLAQDDGLGHAYDAAPFYDGKIQWKDIEAFNFMATLHFRAAMELGVMLEWGGHFSSRKRDRPHFQLKKGI